jgi:succinyldiaminopimelate transaminase
MSIPDGFVPPPYPYDRLVPVRELADRHEGGAVDLSVGTPCDPPPAAVVAAMCSSDSERGYPPSVGTAPLRSAIADWMERRFGTVLDEAHVAVCVGTKELVVGIPHWLRLRNPRRDTVLYPAISYPSYAMGAQLAGCRAVAVPVDGNWRIDLRGVSAEDARRALCLWVNTPANPTGAVDDLVAAAEWGRSRDIPVLSDECYAEFTWVGEPVGPQRLPGRTILESGSEGVLAVHSLSKRSNLAGLRVGFYAGDPLLVGYLSEIRKHSGLMVPGPAQAAAVVALSDHDHVALQRERYRNRLSRLATVLGSLGLDAPMPDGGFYLWVPAPEDDAWALTERLARELGVVVSPGEFYGPGGSGHVRVAVVQPDERIDLIIRRAG